MTDATLTSWIDVPAGHDFPLANLPFGIFSTQAAAPVLGCVWETMLWT